MGFDDIESTNHPYSENNPEIGVYLYFAATNHVSDLWGITPLDHHDFQQILYSI